MTTTAIAPPSPTFASVPFHGHQILAARVGQEVRVPMKPFCEQIGLAWDGQRQRIQRDPVLKEGASMMLVPTEGGEQLLLTLGLELLVGFLFTADTRRYPAEKQAIVDLFRRECFRALHAHFFGRRELTPAAAPAPVRSSWQELDATRRSAPALLQAITTETRPAVRRYLHALLAHDADRLGLAPPALGELGTDGDDADALIARLAQGLKVLTSRGKKWNHVRSATGRMALVLPELGRLFAAADIDVQVDDRLRAALTPGAARTWRITVETIESAITRKLVLATVLHPWPGQA